MKPMTTRLVWTEDHENGIEGWKIKRIKAFNPSTDASGLVHDLLEHYPRDKGTFYHEVGAYGAVIAYRSESNHLYSNEKPERKLFRLAEELGYGLLYDFFTRKTPHYLKWLPTKLQKTKDKSLIKFVDTAYDKAVNQFDTAWLRNWYGEYNRDDFIHWLEQWIIHGYTRAKKIIDKSGWDAHYIWDGVYHAVKAWLYDKQYPIGAEVSITIYPNSCNCEIIPINYKRLFE